LLPLFPLYVEWMCRLQPGCKWPLPYEFKSYGFLQSFVAKDIHQFKFLESYENFVKFMNDDSNIVSFLSHLPFATLTAKSTQTSATFENFIHDCKTYMQPVERARPAYARGDKPENGSITLRQAAMKRLEKMRASARDSYAGLVKAYLESLDESSRRIILDVQKHMKPDMFDQHLNNRMLHFMVENPTLWQHNEVAFH
jgi:hypothetical protein